MKKSFIFLLCILTMLTLGAISANAEAEDTLTVTVTVADGLEIPENGLAVTVYAGNLLSGGSSRGSVETSYSYPYEKLARSFYHASDWLTKHRFNPLSHGNDTVYIMPDTRSATLELSVKGYSYIAWHTQKYSGYIGSGGQPIDPAATETAITISYVKGVKLSGTVTVPEADNDVNYHISVMGDVSEKPEIEYDYTFIESDTLKSGETTFEYSTYVRPDMDYTIYLTFNDTYKIQQKDIHIETSDTTLNFTAEKANKITGTIKLPEAYNEFKGENGETVENVQFMLKLQDAAEPHDLIDMDGVILSPDHRSAEFTLYNISDAEEIIVYYNGIYPYRPKNLCEGAAYRDNTSCTLSVKDAARLKNKDQSIVVNMVAGKTVKITIDNQSLLYHDDFMENLCAIMTDGSGAYVRGYGNSYDYYMTLPEDCGEYILWVTGGDDTRGVYYSENGFTRDKSEATPVSASETEKTVVLDAYEPDLPVIYEIIEGSDSSKVTVNYTYNSDFDTENVHVYTVWHYADGDVMIDSNRPRKLRSQAYVHNEFGISENVDSVYMMIWDENMRPLCEKIVIKESTEE